MSSPNENHEKSNVTDSLPGKLTKKLNKANKQVTTLKKKLKVSQQKSRRLKKKVKSLKDITKELSDKNLITSSCQEMLESNFSGVPFALLKIIFALPIDNIEVERVNSAEILGVMIQNNMNWWEHVTKIKKAWKRLYMLRLLKRANADTKALSTVYITVIRPVLEYACRDKLIVAGGGFFSWVLSRVFN